jgi:hypothetical protein
MGQPHQGDGQPTGRPGHPDPMPSPDPDPPQPVPPPEPIPAPEPPKADDQPTQWQPTVPAGSGQQPAAGTGWAQQPPPGTPGDQQSQGWEQPEPFVPKRRRTGLWVSLALAVVLLLCGGGGVSAYLLLRDSENGDGAPDPATAVTRFLTAVYKDRDAKAADGLVCSEARDTTKVSAKVDEVKGYDTRYDHPSFTWENPSVASESDERALVSVGITMTTLDEKIARQQLTFTVVKKTGWWVCEVAG